MILTFAVLGWGFYELSGGAEFSPPEPIPAPRITHAEPEAPMGAALADVAPAMVVPEPVVAVAADFAPEPLPAVVPAVVEPPAETRNVVGSRVNMRLGPGTSHGVVTVLSRGEAAEVLEVDGRWARIRSGGAEGWMALSMLSDPI